ncbi:MAG: septum formation inhibitor Maf [Pseudobutyrivibrio sp.]|uniref:Maf family protein n=1 Tax=Pseudobutyrivibrio sp. TaxID=2014367 RepID=UPI0025E55EB4|nr:Maf family protein [Pseudobutyrivibrio sp.]MBQ8489446.1 septum formation inhibitor Maf [Pseudobutyrivibrio sp.]
MKIILASNSPRRKELLTQADIDFEVKSADVEEITDKTKPEEVVMDLSQLKAKAIAKDNPGRRIIAADTVVAFNGQILGKPKDEADAFRMLKELSGETHHVYTGVTIIEEDGRVNTFYEATAVSMYDNSDELINRYIATGEPMDKAGAYGIQGKGAVLVKEICGDYNNVVGLPLAKVYRNLY